MSLTSFFPIFLIFLVISIRSVRAWLAVTAVAAFFQGATPILVVGGGRFSGIAPAYALLAVGVWHFIALQFSETIQPRQKVALRLNGRVATLALFTAIGVAGAILLPRLFEGAVRVLPPRSGLDTGFTVPLAPAGTNLIQSFYLLCNFTTAFLVYVFIQKKVVSVSDLIRGVTIGGLISVTLGFYQLVSFYVGLPWPADVINSNLGVMQLNEQTAMGLRRMSATFLEPSIMSLHFLCVFGLVGLGQQRWWVALPFLIALAVSTSSLAYFGLGLLLIVWTLLEIPTRGVRLIPPLLAIATIVLIALALDQLAFDGELANRLLLKKFESGSGIARLNADRLAIDSFTGSFGLGTGVGSARASSFLSTMLATMGLPGFLLFCSFATTCLWCLFGNRHSEARGVFFGILGSFAGWFLAIPDISLPLVWLLMGAALSYDRLRPKPSELSVRF